MAEGIRWDWVNRHTDDILRTTVEHAQLTVISVALATAVALPIAVAVRNRPVVFATTGALADVLYTIPSLALFAFLLPWVGIGTAPAVIGLAAYALTMLIRNAVVGLRAVPAPVREAARGMGLTRTQMLLRIELPLAMPAIFAGLRLATVSTVGIGTIAVFVGGPGLGELILNDGIDRDLFLTPIVIGAAIATAMALVFDALLLLALRALTPWTRARGAV
ncbi:MAG: ABC transporter permease [Thermoleophilia bacterium]